MFYKKNIFSLSIACVFSIYCLLAGQFSYASCQNQVPAISGANARVISSGNYSSSYPAWKAFDSSNTSLWLSDLWETPAWVGYHFGSNVKVDRYSIQYANGSITSRAPKDFTLQASNNGSSWVVVDTRTNQTNWGGSEQRTYTVTNAGSYRYYRLVVTDDNDTRSGVVTISIGRLKLESCAQQFGSLQGNWVIYQQGFGVGSTEVFKLDSTQYVWAYSVFIDSGDFAIITTPENYNQQRQHHGDWYYDEFSNRLFIDAYDSNDFTFRYTEYEIIHRSGDWLTLEIVDRHNWWW